MHNIDQSQYFNCYNTYFVIQSNLIDKHDMHDDLSFA